jgi:hypothetical protein
MDNIVSVRLMLQFPGCTGVPMGVIKHIRYFFIELKDMINFNHSRRDASQMDGAEIYFYKLPREGRPVCVKKYFGNC